MPCCHFERFELTELSKRQKFKIIYNWTLTKKVEDNVPWQVPRRSVELSVLILVSFEKIPANRVVSWDWCDLTDSAVNMSLPVRLGGIVTFHGLLY